MGRWWEIITVILISSTKYLLGAAEASLVLSPFSGFVFSIVGAMLGVGVYMVLGDHLKHWMEKRGKRKFNKTMRFVVKIRKGSGLTGVAFLTPVLLTIPVGVYIALNIEDSKAKIALYMFVSIAFWAGLIFGMIAFFDVDILSWLGS